jgi:hypothetical protein
MSDFSGLLVSTDSVLREGYLDKIMQLVESGIIENIMSYNKSKERPKNDDPVVLSIDHLLIWFQLWAGLLLIAVLFFLVEILVARIAKVLMKKAMKELKSIRKSIDSLSCGIDFR